MMWCRNLFPVVTVVLALWCVAASVAVVERGHDVGKRQIAVQRASACEKDSDCGGLSDVKCTFDSVDETTKVCQCDNENKTYVPLNKQCSLPCKSNECFGGRCRLKVDGKKFCACFKEYSGDFCEISACEKLCGKNDNVHCHFDHDIDQMHCECPGEKQGFDYDTKSCRDCDCGHRSALCEYHGDIRFCDCDTGSYEKDGICEDCDCGEEDTNTGCEFPDGKKKCICNSFHKLKDGKCTPCYCGWHGLDCNFEDGKQVCSCPEGFLQDHDNVCRSCNCGVHGKCSLDEHNGEVCTCNEGYADHGGICEPCKCSGGTKSDNCKFSFFGAVECECKDRYMQKQSECLECDCGENGHCHFDLWSGQKECQCYIGYREEDGKCIRN